MAGNSISFGAGHDLFQAMNGRGPMPGAQGGDDWVPTHLTWVSEGRNFWICFAAGSWRDFVCFDLSHALFFSLDSFARITRACSR